MHLCYRGRIAKGTTAHTHTVRITHTPVPLMLCHFQLSFVPTLFPLYFIYCFSILVHYIVPFYSSFLPFSHFCSCSCFIFFYISYHVFPSSRAFLTVSCTSGSLSPPPSLSWETKTPTPSCPSPSFLLFSLSPPPQFHSHRLLTTPLSLLSLLP